MAHPLELFLTAMLMLAQKRIEEHDDFIHRGITPEWMPRSFELMARNEADPKKKAQFLRCVNY